jgi:WD40 repeat protein
MLEEPDKCSQAPPKELINSSAPVCTKLLQSVRSPQHWFGRSGLCGMRANKQQTTGTQKRAALVRRIVRLYDERSGSGSCATLRPSGSHSAQPWDRVRGIRFASDSKTLAAAGSDRALRIWDVRQAEAPVKELWPQSDSVWALAGDEALATVYTGARDGSVRPHDPCL